MPLLPPSAGPNSLVIQVRAASVSAPHAPSLSYTACTAALVYDESTITSNTTPSTETVTELPSRCCSADRLSGGTSVQTAARAMYDAAGAGVVVLLPAVPFVLLPLPVGALPPLPPGGPPAPPPVPLLLTPLDAMTNPTYVAGTLYDRSSRAI